MVGLFSKKLLLAAAVAVCVSVPASAASRGWYLGVEGGLNLAPEARWQDTGPARMGGNDKTFSFHRGYGAIGQAGYGLGPVRFEGELGWRGNSADQFKSGGGNGKASGRLTVLDEMANVYYDFRSGKSFVPYLGAGVGYAQVSAENMGAFNAVATNASSGVFAYQLIAGAAYKLTNNISIKADYRYFRTADFTLKEQAGWATPLADLKGHYQANNVLVGMTYAFR